MVQRQYVRGWYFFEDGIRKLEYKKEMEKSLNSLYVLVLMSCIISEFYNLRETKNLEGLQR